MSYTKQVTIWCDVGDPGCWENTQVDTPRVSAARDEAENLERWDCSPDRDVCPMCLKDGGAPDA